MTDKLTRELLGALRPDPRTLALKAGVSAIAVSDGSGGFVRSLVTWKDDWNTSAYGVRQLHVEKDRHGEPCLFVFTAEDELRTRHIPAGLWLVAQQAQKAEVRTLYPGTAGEQECLVFEEVGDAWDRYEENRAARNAAA